MVLVARKNSTRLILLQFDWIILAALLSTIRSRKYFGLTIMDEYGSDESFAFASFRFRSFRMSMMRSSRFIRTVLVLTIKRNLEMEMNEGE